MARITMLADEVAFFQRFLRKIRSLHALLGKKKDAPI